MDPAPLRPMTATEILDGAFTLYRRHFTTLVATALIVSLLPMLLMLAGGPVATIAQMTVPFFVMAACIHLASEFFLGRPARIADGLAVGARRFLPLLVGSVVYLVIVVAGTLALIVPGFCLWCMLFAYAPIIVLEGRWTFIKRSRELARDQWGKIAGVMFLAMIIAMLPSLALNLGAMSVLQIGFNEVSERVDVQIATMFLGALLGPFTSIVYTLLYYDQRVRKEGLDVQLAVDALAAGPDARLETAGSGSSRR